MTKKLKVIDKNKIYPIYLQWFAKPPGKRRPPTLEEFLTRYKITKKDIIDFHERQEFYDDLENAAVKWGQQRLPELLHLLYDKIKSGKSSSDIKVFKDLVYPEKKQTQSNNVNVILNLQDEQYKQIIQREAKLLN